jgi:hypothetical protein
VLPIELVDFSGFSTAGGIVLEWETETEINNDFFTIERSFDGVTFEGIAEVPGAGSSLRRLQYHYLDIAPHSGTNYYRLRQTDYDGTNTVSDLIAVAWGQTGTATLLPNPVQEELTLAFSASTDGQGTVRVFDLLGRMQDQRGVSLSEGANRLSLSMTTIPAGNYLILLEDESGQMILREPFVKR